MNTGRKLFIRSLINLASEAIPYVWPMRTFVTRNPLRGFEHMDFEEAARRAEVLFRGRAYLSREEYRHLYRLGYIKDKAIKEKIKEFLLTLDIRSNLPYLELLFLLMTREDINPPVMNAPYLRRVRYDDGIISLLEDKYMDNPADVCRDLILSIGYKYTLEDVVELLSGRRISNLVDELTIKTLVDFLDEGQSTVDMPDRELGLYRSWRKLALRNVRFLLWGGSYLRKLVESFEDPEVVVEHILKEFKLPESMWEDYIRLEMARLKGFVGFIRWRSQNKYYYWQKIHPVDVVDYTAIRLIIAKSLLDKESKHLAFKPNYLDIQKAISERPEFFYLLYEYHSQQCPPEVLDNFDRYIKNPALGVREYIKLKAHRKAQSFWIFARDWIEKAGLTLDLLTPDVLNDMLNVYENFVKEEGRIWLEALEDSHIEELISSIGASIGNSVQKTDRLLMQALFCIDVRSERYRRNLEKIGSGKYQTFGIAGFFGVPMSLVSLDKGHEEFLCPVIITPKNVVFEIPRGKEMPKNSERIKDLVHGVKHHVLAPFVAVEMVGFAFGFDFIGKTLMPRAYNKLKDSVWSTERNTTLMIDKLTPEDIEKITTQHYLSIIKHVLKEEFGKNDIPEEELLKIYRACLGEAEYTGLDEAISRLKSFYGVERGYVELFKERLRSIGFTKEEQAFLVANALKSIGLVHSFAPVILVLGHGSRSENNPYESALDCGACGGASGIFNAKAFCLMANNPEVRNILSSKHGINIPADTVFIPGLHNTTTDEVSLEDLEMLSAKHLPLLREINKDLKEASEKTRQERAPLLDVDNQVDLISKAYDWSEVRPEWGLSGNYAFIIAGRHLTASVKLDGRTFLHSYDYRLDKKGFLLENILSGPAIVGQWINSEYYFSTVDNEVFGSGSKVYHNVFGNIGVMTGNFSDLRTGLPLQTVFKEGKPYHAPIRLILLIEAPIEFVKNVMSRLRKIRELMEFRWINALVYDPEKKTFYRYLKGQWVEQEAMLKSPVQIPPAGGWTGAQ